MPGLRVTVPVTIKTPFSIFICGSPISSKSLSVVSADSPSGGGEFFDPDELHPPASAALTTATAPNPLIRRFTIGFSKTATPGDCTKNRRIGEMPIQKRSRRPTAEREDLTDSGYYLF